LYFERDVKTAGPGAGTAENRHYLSAEKGSFLLITSNGAIQTEAQSNLSNAGPTQLANAEQRYWHKDHLGSIVASTNQNLSVIERMAYDPFGKRRFTNGAYDQVGTIDATSTNRGFTGHEHLDELDFIHMNARVYDPDIGRFLSPDPTIPYPNNPQSFNRYSYVQNNPLNRVDPDGFADTNAQSSSAEFVGPPAPGTQAPLNLGGNGTPATGTAQGTNIPGQVNPTLSNIALKGAIGLSGVFPADAPIHDLGRALATVTAYGVGKATGDQALADIAMQDLQANKEVNVNLLGILIGGGRAPGKGLSPSPQLALSAPKAPSPRGQSNPSTTAVDPLTGMPIGRIVVDSKGNAMIEPVGGRTVPAGPKGQDTHTTYPNGSNYQRNNPSGHKNNSTPHGHGHGVGTGPGMKGQGPSLDTRGNVVPSNSPAAHWPTK
jgi:RHS repeat-associated protein